MNRDAYEITGSAYENTWTHQRQKRRKHLLTCETTNSHTVTSEVVNQKTVTSEGSNNLLNPSTLPSEEKHIDFNTVQEQPLKRKLQTYNIEELKTFKKTKLREEVEEVAPEFIGNGEFAEKLFSFSCTVAMGRQFCLNEEDKAIISFLCIEGNREQFHQMFLFFKNAFHSDQVNLKERK